MHHLKYLLFLRIFFFVFFEEATSKFCILTVKSLRSLSEANHVVVTHTLLYEGYKCKIFGFGNSDRAIIAIQFSNTNKGETGNISFTDFW